MNVKLDNVGLNKKNLNVRLNSKINTRLNMMLVIIKQNKKQQTTTRITKHNFHQDYNYMIHYYNCKMILLRYNIKDNNR